MKLASASCQLAYWDSGNLRIVHYRARRTFSANPVALELIRFFFTPRTIRDALLEFSAYSRHSVTDAILKLIEAELLLEYDSPEWRQDNLIESLWKRWLPEGGFHFLTKDTAYIGPDWTVAQRRQSLPTTPPPRQFKTIENADPITLPQREIEKDCFFETLHARRTHRAFAKGKVPLGQVSRLLQATWGVQGYFESPVYGTLPYKTSPSGGARHPIEVYLMALRVDGLRRGIYHYHARDHCLAKLPAGASPRIASEYCADQPYFGEAAALFIMTAVFARTMWKYGRARAYRVVLLETGHFGQTFCLTATRLGLAPFTTAALKDSLIEQDLGIDGVSESVLYVTGIGVPARP